MSQSWMPPFSSPAAQSFPSGEIATPTTPIGDFHALISASGSTDQKAIFPSGPAQTTDRPSGGAARLDQPAQRADRRLRQSLGQVPRAQVCPDRFGIASGLGEAVAGEHQVFELAKLGDLFALLGIRLALSDRVVE